MYYYCSYQSPIGKLTIASNEKNIVGLWLDKQKYYMDVLQGKNYIEKKTKAIIQAEKWLDRYFNGEKMNIKYLPIEFIGSSFQKEVWDILCLIPYGKVITYGDIAKEIAKKRKNKSMSAQAIGGAVSRNPISIIVPCHRVVGANGKLTGYAGGLDAKCQLLKIEGIKL